MYKVLYTIPNILYICRMEDNNIKFINNGVMSDINNMMGGRKAKRVAIIIENEDAPEKKRYVKENYKEFFFCFSEFSYSVMKSKLRGESMRLLWLLLSIMRFKNEVDLNVKFLYGELECKSRQSIYNSIKELKEKGFLVKAKGDNGREYWAINSYGFWKGTQKERKEFILTNGDMPKLITNGV